MISEVAMIHVLARRGRRWPATVSELIGTLEIYSPTDDDLFFLAELARVEASGVVTRNPLPTAAPEIASAGTDWSSASKSPAQLKAHEAEATHPENIRLNRQTGSRPTATASRHRASATPCRDCWDSLVHAPRSDEDALPANRFIGVPRASHRVLVSNGHGYVTY